MIFIVTTVAILHPHNQSSEGGSFCLNTYNFTNNMLLLSLTQPTPSPMPHHRDPDLPTFQDTPASTRQQIHVLLSSCLSCLCTMTLTNPLEVLKLKAQFSPISCSRYPHISFKDLYSCACTKFQWRDTFKGLHLNLSQGLISAVLYMQVYEYLRARFVTSHLPSTLATFGSAFVARSFVTVVLVPIEAMRIRSTNSTTEQEIKTSQRGFKVTLIRDLTYSCLLWLGIETLRDLLVGGSYRSRGQQKNINHLLKANVLPAFLSASLISVLTTPIDTIKTRIQSGVSVRERRLWYQLKEIYHKQGLVGLFSGVQFRAVKNSISSVCYISLYEYLIDKFSRSSFPH